MKKNNIAKLIGAGLLASIALSGYAESAPVYDADSLPQQFDSPDQPMADEVVANNEQAVDQEDNTFVPMQGENANPDARNAGLASQGVPIANNPGAGSVEERLQRIEQQLYTLQDNTQSSDSSPRIDFLLGQVQALRNQVEHLSQELERIQSGQQGMVPIAASKSPSGNSKNAIGAPLVPPGKANASKSMQAAAGTQATKLDNSAQPNVAEEQQIYQTAYNLIKTKKYNDAVNTLQSMLKRYPSGQFASNAHYWLGELYGVMGKNDQALTEFSTVVKSYPDSPRVSDAQLKVGLIYATQLKWPDAKAAFKRVINHYPGTTSSRLAAEQLKQIQQAGH